jgi:hypothetical protein
MVLPHLNVIIFYVTFLKIKYHLYLLIAYCYRIIEMNESSNSGISSLYTCEFCGSIFDTASEKEEHIKLKHSDGNSART